METWMIVLIVIVVIVLLIAAYKLYEYWYSPSVITPAKSK